jgi:hypothetical protein
MSASPKDYTASKLKQMGLGSDAIDRDAGTIADDEGNAAGKNSSRVNRRAGGAVHGAGRKSSLGRPGRAIGGPVSGALHRTLRTEKETVRDEPKDTPRGRLEANMHDARPGAIQSRKYAQPIRVHQDKMPRGDRTANADERDASKANRKAVERSGAFAAGGRAGFAKGGRAKGKTTVNVIVAPQGGGAGGPPPPPMMPPPGAMPPPMPPPQRPPMPPPQAGPSVNVMPPSGAAPMGAAGAPPPGVPPGMRKRGGRVIIPQAPSHQGRGKFPKSAPVKRGAADFHRDGKDDFGPGGTPAKARIKQTHGSGSGLGRIDNARREA